MTLQGRATLARILTAAGVDFGWNGYPIALGTEAHIQAAVCLGIKG
jgi:hypothetical protein